VANYGTDVKLPGPRGRAEQPGVQGLRGPQRLTLEDRTNDAGPGHH
jgi:hypothetical protein